MYQFGEFQLDLRGRTLRRGGDRIALTAKAFDTLVALVQQAGTVVGKDELMRRVWPDTIVEEANLSQQVFMLRKALGDGPKDQRFIQTVPRHGYRFAAPVVQCQPPSAPPPGAAPILRLMLPLGETPLALGPTSPIALSPDGRTLAYVAREGARTCLYLRALDRSDSVRVSQLEDASSPFFSPDSRWVGCFVNGRLVKVLATGGSPIGICNAGPECRGATWTRTGDIVFSPAPAAGLVRVSADGGVPRVVTNIDFAVGERTHRWPSALPDGQHVLCTVAAAGSASFEEAEIAVVSVVTGERRIVLPYGSYATYLATGHLAYMRGNSLMAAPFDVQHSVLTGPPIPVVDGVTMQPTGAGCFTCSNSGTLLYVTGPAQTVKRRLVRWSTGDIAPMAIPEQVIEEPRISPDGTRMVFGVRSASSDLWMFDFESQTTSRLTTDGDNFAAIWTPDGQCITFSSNRFGSCEIFSQRVADGVAERVAATDCDLVPGCWLSDGRILLFTKYDPQRGASIWTVQPARGDEPQKVLGGFGNVLCPAISPDGAWLAFVSDVSAHLEIYVTRFSDCRARTQVSMDGGSEPVWARDGCSLYYRSGSRIMRTAFNSVTGARVGRPEPVVDGPFEPGAVTGLPNYDVDANGGLYLVAQTSQQAEPMAVSVVVNWFADVAHRLGS
jgi:DNA-binding winged helix-turn-helix (wHTH) protein